MTDLKPNSVSTVDWLIASTGTMSANALPSTFELASTAVRKIDAGRFQQTNSEGISRHLGPGGYAFMDEEFLPLD